MMKRLTILFLIFVTYDTKGQTMVNIQNNFGYTIVNVSEAMDIPEYSEITDEGLVEWNQFNYKGLVQIFFLKNDPISIGSELGINRLYYWEKKFIPPLSSPRWNWGTIWTAHLGGLIKRTIADQYYITTGASIYFFLNGTGTTVGFPFAIGHEISLSDKIKIPIEFRVDVILGDATPVALGGGVGFLHTIKE
ncbi:MAG: hypothetical protein ACE5D0_06855 [Fidelibacterota bacterium]